MSEGFERLERELPYAIRDKLRYYLDFVHDRLFEVARLEGAEEMIADVRREVDTVFLLRMLYEYFVIGYRNYVGMLSYLESMQVDGFRIGTTDFSSTSLITRQWRQLASGLESLLSVTDLARLVVPTLSTDDVIRDILQTYTE